MKCPRISVLIPCYNREAYIRQCVSSVTDQSFRDLEIIICDNASTDRTYAILEELAAKDPRIKLLRNDKNLGPIPNWKRCLDQASGEFVHWMWSDDYVEPGFYELMINGLDGADASLALASYKIYEEKMNTFRTGGHYKRFDVLEGRKIAMGVLERIPQWITSPAAWLLPTALVKEHVYNRIPVYAGYDCNRTAIGADLLMIAGCALHSERVVSCREACAVFRAHAGSISISRPTWRHFEVAKMWFLLANRLDKGLIHKVWLMLRAARIRSPRLLWHILTRWPVASGKEESVEPRKGVL